MSVTLSRILSRRPRDGIRGEEWIGRSSLPASTLSMGGIEGDWNPETVQTPPVLEQGLAVVLEECLVTRFDKDWGVGAGAAWSVSACQEDSEYVPGIGVQVEPHPPCMLCEPCVSGNHVHCIQSAASHRQPGWIARDMVLPAWSARRGVLQAPATVSARSRVFAHALACMRHAIRGAGKAPFGRVAVVGADLPGILAGLVLERIVPGSSRCLLDSCTARLDSSERWGYHRAVASFDDLGSQVQEAPDLVVLADDQPGALRRALESCAVGGTVLLSVSGTVDGCDLDWNLIWRRGLSIRSGRGCSPDDLRVALDWLPDLEARLLSIPVASMPFEQASGVKDLLDSDPLLAGVVLVA